MAILVFLVNPLCALMTFASLIGYAIVYTGWLKRADAQNIVIGGIAAPRRQHWAGARSPHAGSHARAVAGC